MIKKLLLLATLLTGALFAQQENVTGTVLNTDGTPLAGGVLSVLLTNSAGVSYDNLPYQNLSAIPVRQAGANLDSNGTFSLVLTSNAAVSGSMWQFTVCSPSANAQCATILQSITANTSLSALLSSALVSVLNPSGNASNASIQFGQNTGNSTVFMGDSITAGTGSTGANFVGQAIAISQGLINIKNDAGIGGNTTTQMLARFMTDVVAYHPSKVVILGGVNDINQDNANGWSTAFNNIQAMVQLSLHYGIQPIIATLLPSNTATLYPGIPHLNTLLTRYALNNQNVTLVDFYSACADPTTGMYKTGYFFDGIHPNPTCSNAMAQNLVNQTSNLYYAHQNWLQTALGDTTNLQVNPLFLTLVGGAGTAPTGWSTTVGTSTITSTACTTDCVGNWINIDYGIPSGTGTSSTVGPTISGANFPNSTDVAQITLRFKISGLATNGGTVNFYIGSGLNIINPGNWQAFDISGSGGVAYATFPKSLFTNLSVFTNFVSAGASASHVVVSIAQVSVKNLSALGIN